MPGCRDLIGLSRRALGRFLASRGRFVPVRRLPERLETDAGAHSKMHNRHFYPGSGSSLVN